MTTNINNSFKGDPKLGLCGFRNMGNTCYMNSILQLLIHSQTLVNFLLCDTNPFTLDEEENTSFVDLIIEDKIKAPFITGRSYD